MALKDRIRKRLHNYKIALNKPETDLPFKAMPGKRVAVIGGGIAGISAAANLAERGFEVQLFERSSYLGGKVGSWTFQSGTEELRTEHGFHAFFRQYYNLRDFMKKTGSYKHLQPIDDYLILYEKDKKQGFNNLETTPGLNILALKKHGVYGWPTLINPLSAPLLNLLQFHPEKTFKKFDNESFASFARRTRLPKKMKLVFNSFTRAFFSKPEDMSMAEMIKSFHFYFLSNDGGLIYDVLDDDFEHTFLSYCREFIQSQGGRIHLESPVNSIKKNGEGFKVNGEDFNYVILCTDVKGSRSIIEQSADLQAYKTFSRQMEALPASGRYAVYRIWTDRLEADTSLPCFVFTDRLQCLDSVSLYHKMEKESARWSGANNGGIFELHCYSMPDDLTDAAQIKSQMITELYHYFPELEGMTIHHDYFQLRDDFPGFQTNAYKDRPEIETEIENFYLAGDWVKMDNSSMLMEAAYTSGALAANAILEKEGLTQNLLHGVPRKGLLA